MEAQKYNKIYKLSNNLVVNVEIIDIPGYEKYRDIYETYYNKANSIILVYDITNETSFDECCNYFSLKIKEKCKDNVKVILLGNKTDLEYRRQVSLEEAKNFSNLNHYIFKEISCLKNDNIFDLFEELIGLTINNNCFTFKGKENKTKNKETKNDNNTCNLI